MSAAYGGVGEALEYSATAVFDFTTTQRSAGPELAVSNNFSGIGFHSLDFSVTVDDGATQTYIFSSLTGAESFFTAHALDLGSPSPADAQSVQLDYSLSYAGTYGERASRRFWLHLRHRGSADHRHIPSPRPGR